VRVRDVNEKGQGCLRGRGSREVLPHPIVTDFVLYSEGGGRSLVNFE
jgi:hypothetical protein